MKLKKTLALGLVAAMAASFTACGSSGSGGAGGRTAGGKADRKSVVKGKRVDLGGRRIIKK